MVENHCIFDKVDILPVVVNDNDIPRRVVKIHAFQNIFIMRIYNNQQTVFRNLRQCIHWLQKMGAVAALRHPVDQLCGQTALPVDHHIGRLLHQTHRTCQAAGRTHGVQIAEAVSHEKDLIRIFNQFLHCQRNGANLRLGLLLHAL